MLTSPFQTEQPMNIRFFTRVWMLSLRVDFKLPALSCFSVWEGGCGFFLLLLPVAGGGGQRQWGGTHQFFGLYRGQNLWPMGSHTVTELLSLAQPRTKLLCVGTAVGVKMAAAELTEQVLTSLVLACLISLIKRCWNVKVFFLYDNFLGFFFLLGYFGYQAISPQLLIEG